ncbi:pumilio homolog 2-like isoform X2 [Oppia nitens]|uniref:pumilio homolog 2-like isoform X2 n=1 Tax=Oppia nitens TaxID=1686743 RepID=UPI0023DCA811|nr:pumilio homolog 2-like isoform X2 [Oppia nitens]
MNEVVWHQERHPSLAPNQSHTSHHPPSHPNHHNSHHSNHNPIHPSLQSLSTVNHSHGYHQHSHNSPQIGLSHPSQQSLNGTVMLANQTPQSVVIAANDMQNSVHNQKHNQNSIRSQDDAMVRYFFQRPQTDPDFQNYNKHQRWALGDDSVLEVRQGDGELVSEFQALDLETDGYASTKKIWGMEEQMKHPDDPKGLFLGEPQWGRDSTWSTGGPNENVSDHAVSQPIMVNSRRSGSYPGSDGTSMLSPRSNDTGGLGVKMVEYVLGSSPTAKDLDGRMHSRLMSDKQKKQQMKNAYEESKMHHKDNTGAMNVMQSNGIVMQNGLDDESKMFSRTPGCHQLEDDNDLSKNHMLVNDMSKMKPNDGLMHAGMPSHIMSNNGPHFTDFDHGGIDQLQFEYPSQIIDSPGILDYNPMYRPNQPTGQMPTALIAPHQQQFNLAQQQSQSMPSHTNPGMSGPNGNGNNPYPPQNPYYGTDPFSASMGHIIPAGPPPAMLAQYYGMPWGMYPGMIQSGQVQSGQASHLQQQQQQQQQQQIIARSNGARPLTPQGAGDGANQVIQAGQYQMVPHGYYDQNGSLMMGNSGARGMNPAAMRIMPPMIVNQSGNNNIRMMPNAGQTPQQHSGPPNAMFSSNGTNGANNGVPNYSNNTNGNQMGFNPNMSRNQVQGYGNNGMGPIGASIASGMGLGSSSPRRESFDGRRDGLGAMFPNSLDSQISRHLGSTHKNGQFYGLGPGIGSPGPLGMLPSAQSLTPPPSLDGSNSSLNLNALGSRGGIMSAAPGAENKYLVRNGAIAPNMFPSNNSFNNRMLARNSSLEKSSGRSRLLEDFRNNRFPNLQLRDLADHIVEFSQDQHGSRFIQQKLERATPTEKQMVFNEILGSAYNLMTDVFGNYVIQKFFEFGTPDQKQQLAQKVRGHVLQLALQMYGCRVIQKALESIPQDQQKDVVKELDGHILKCVKDQNGNHVVQKCIECVEPVALQFIINAFQGQVFALSTHPYGCRVIQRILEHCNGEQTSSILEELHQNTEQLVQDQYGNYVVQHVLEHGRPEDKNKIIHMVRGKVLNLSQHKFASNVVERCVTHASRAERALLIEEVCTYNDSALYTMMKDQYANYVVQKMIEVAETPQRKLLLQRIRPHMPALRKYTYGKHILAKLEKFMVKSNNDVSHDNNINNQNNWG